jgi:stage II sporulation protein E
VLGYALAVLPPRPFQTVWLSLVVAAGLWQLIPSGWVGELSRLVTNMIAGYDETSLPEQIGRIGQVMAEIGNAFHVDDEEPSTESQASEIVVDSVCKRCSLYRACWEDNFYRSYRGLVDLMALAEHRRVEADDVTGDLGRRCIRRDELAQATNHARIKVGEQEGYRQRVRESRALAEVQLKGVAEIMEAMAEDWQGAPYYYRRAKVALDYHVGIAKRPRSGGLISGDTELVRELANNRVLLGLSDGMGVGARAAWESGTAMALISRLLEAGFSPKLAVHTVNTTLLLRSPDDRFATLDLLLIDRRSQTGELIKVAASPSFLRRRGQIEVIRSQSLPIGILDQVAVEPMYHDLEPEDVIVMVTDGVLEEQGPEGDRNLAEILARLPIADVQWMAETILSYMLDQEGDGRDDAAVMVVKVMGHRAIREISETIGQLTIGEWTRVTPPRGTRAAAPTPFG